MKKTLITLAALAASVAQAADVTSETWDSLIYNSADPKTENSITWTSSLTMNPVLDWEAAHSVLGGGRAFIYAVDGSHASAALGFSLVNEGTTSTATNYSAYIMRHNGTGQYSLDNAALSYTMEDGALAIESIDYSNMTTHDGHMGGSDVAMYFAQATYENEGKLALAIAYDDSTRTFTLGALTATGGLNYVTITMTEAWQTSTNNFRGYDLKDNAVNAIEQVLVFNTALSNDQIAAVAAEVVPEPTTATLSLLALAGLAARRRRK